MENKRKPLPDSDARQAAIVNTDENIVVIAGAGTGKTTLLIDRILYLLLGRQLPVESLVILTFTEKAAGEMKSRLVDKLTSLYHYLEHGSDEHSNKLLVEDIIARHNTSSDNLRTCITRTFEHIDKAHIDTIHSFAAHILRLYPLESGVDPEFKVDKSDNFNTIFTREWSNWLEHELKHDSSHKKEWMHILSYIDLDHIELLTRKLADFNIPLDTLTTLPAQIKTVLQGYTSDIQQFLSKAVNNKNIDKQVNILHSTLSAIDPKTIDTFREHIKKEDMALLCKRVSKTKDWTQEDTGRIERIRKSVCSLLMVEDKLLVALLGLLIPFIKKFRTAFLQEGFVSFSGLLVLTRNLLRDNIRIREELKKAYASILIDEFQDTDPLQAEMLLFLAEQPGKKSTSLADVCLAPGRIFIVGDPKQSIYYFRGADISAFSVVRDLITRQNGKEYTLSTNFRSHSAIIKTVNTIFSKLIRKNRDIQPDYSPIFVRPGNEPTLPLQKVELILMQNSNDEDENSLKSHQSRELEARTIAEWIYTSVHKADIPQKDGTTRKLAYKDIAVIMRSLPNVHIYLEELRSYDIPFVVEGEKSFYQAQEVIDFINLLHAIDNPEDKVALTGLLRSPLGGLTDRDIYNLTLDNTLDYRTPAKELKKATPTLRKLYRTLKTLHERTGRISINNLLDEIINTTFIMEIGAESYHREQALANIMKFRRIANDVAEQGITTLQELGSIMREYIEKGVDEGESPLADDTYDAVRIFSVHKSKGLEYPVVFLPNLHGGKGNVISDEPRVIYDWHSATAGINIPKFKIKNSGSIILEDERQEREREEENRILYVACTRAKECLILLGSDTPRKYTYMEKIKRALNFEGLDEDKNNIATSFRAYEDIKKLKPPKGRIQKKKSPPDWDMLAQTWNKRQERCQNVIKQQLFSSPTSLTEQQEERDLFRNTEPSAPGIPAVTGIICHKILEQWDYKTDSLEKLITLITQKEMHTYPHLAINDILPDIKKLLASFSKSEECKTIKESEILGREVPFIMPWKNSIMRGKIDLIYRSGNNTVIVDFKTGKPNKEEKHNLQKEIYTKAVKKILGIKNPTTAFIYLHK